MLRDPRDAAPPQLPTPVRFASRHLGRSAGWDAAIVIPAKDEEKRVRACLDAAGVAIRAAKGVEVGIVLVVNNTADATASVALDWASAQYGVPFVLIDCAFAEAEAGVGVARRLGMDAACAHLAPHGALLVTDADTLVREDWVVRNLAELHGADLVCGTVLGRADEANCLPAAIAAHGSAEWDYLTASIELVARLDPQAHDPAPAHHNAAGASMALSRQVYTAVGGLPMLSLNEDRALAKKVEDHDFRIRFSASAIVETSCRMTGRTEGGMAGALRARALEPDPFADQWLEAADTLALRHGLRGRLRAIWPDRAAMHPVLAEALGPRDAGLILSRPLGPYFGAFFATVEQRSLRLLRHRMRMSDCRRELPRLRHLLASGVPVTGPDHAPAPRSDTHSLAMRNEPAR